MYTRPPPCALRKPPPAFTSRRCKLVSDQLSILFGSISGFDRTFISLLERGVRSPTLSTLFRLAEHLGVKSSEIIRRRGESKVAATGKKGGVEPSQ